MSIAIVGGGVAGCYAAYRLRDAYAGRVDIYEMSDRVGGRLWSAKLKGVAAPIELGGMFFSTLHENVHGLITKELKLPHSQVNWSRRNQFLRGKYLDDDDYADPGKVPYNLVGAEAKLSPEALLVHVLGLIVPDFKSLWPISQTPPASARATFDHLRRLRHEGRPLYDCGFWNVLNDIASNEAYQLLTVTLGSVGLFRNSNAFDAVWNLMQEFGQQQFFKIDAGYQSLPQTLWDACADKVGRHLEHRLVRVDRAAHGLLLTFITPAGPQRRVADSLILAMPRRALQLIDFGDGVFDDAEGFARLRDESVDPAPACKVFMAFDRPWWDESVVGPASLTGADVSAAYTDLPMQQCYYFGVPQAGAPAVLMAAYADDTSSGFWRGLMHPSEPLCQNPVQDAPVALNCSSALAETARRQLDVLHDDIDVPTPSGAVFFDWNCDPFGGGWHAWSPRVRSWEVRKQIRNPAPGLYICGEAYAERHGWVDGAVNSAEMVLRCLGLGRPDWVDVNYEFEREEGNEMSNRISELLIALGESMTLQRVYARDPDALMDAFGLDAKEQDAMRTGDASKIKSAANIGEVAFVIVKHTK